MIQSHSVTTGEGPDSVQINTPVYVCLCFGGFILWTVHQVTCFNSSLNYYVVVYGLEGEACFTHITEVQGFQVNLQVNGFRSI